jgi:hypothetical protein
MVQDILKNWDLVKKLPICYGTQRFITPFTRSRHWIQSWAYWIKPTTPHLINLKYILGAFVNVSCKNAPISLAITACLSVCPYVTAPEQRNEFSCNFTLTSFTTICQRFSILFKWTKVKPTRVSVCRCDKVGIPSPEIPAYKIPAGESVVVTSSHSQPGARHPAHAKDIVPGQHWHHSRNSQGSKVGLWRAHQNYYAMRTFRNLFFLLPSTLRFP